MKTQVVYIIRNVEAGIIKIGIASDLRNRIKSLVGSSGCQMELVGNSLGLHNAPEIEKMLHKFFDDRRRVFEWFNISGEEAVAKMEEFQASHGKIDPIALRYSKGESITALAKEEDCSRQNIIKKLKNYGIHQNVKAIGVETGGRVKDPKTMDNMDIQTGRFVPVESNIKTNGKCFEMKKWRNGKFDVRYFYTLEEARQERDN